MTTPHPSTVLRGHVSDVQTITFDDQELHLVSGDAQGEVRVWSLTDLRPMLIKRLHPVAAGVLNLRLLKAPDSHQVLVSQGRDGTTHLWVCDANLKHISDKPLRTFSTEAYSFCRFSLLAPAPKGGSARNAAETSSAASEAVGNAVAPLPQVGQDAGTEFSRVHTCCRPIGHDTAVAVPAALLAIPGGVEQQAEVRCCACGALVARISPESAGLKLGTCMALFLFLKPDEQQLEQGQRRQRVLLGAGYEDGSVAVWDLASTQRPLALGKLHAEPVMALGIEPGGSRGASGAAEGRLVSFSVDYGAGTVSQRRAIDLRAEGVGDVVVRPDGRIMACAGWDGRVRLYKCASGRAVAVLKYHTSAATAVAFGPSTFQLATGARDGTIALWDVFAKEPSA